MTYVELNCNIYTNYMANTYDPPVLTVDMVVFAYEAGGLRVLLINRQYEPFQGMWALPGGYSAKGETTTETIERVVHTKAGLDVTSLPYYEQLYTFDTIGRDPRGHAVSVTYLGLARHGKLDTENASDSPAFHDINQLPELAFDHRNIVQYALERLRNKLSYTNAAYALLPKTFTLQTVQNLYEAVFNETLDKRNFRKKILSLGILEATGEHLTGSHRPAQLYTFSKGYVQELPRFF